MGESTSWGELRPGCSGSPVDGSVLSVPCTAKVTAMSETAAKKHRIVFWDIGHSFEFCQFKGQNPSGPKNPATSGALNSPSAWITASVPALTIERTAEP